MLKTRYEPLVHWLLPLGLVFTSATQLRLPNLSAGPGEILLTIWVLASLSLRRYEDRSTMVIIVAAGTLGAAFLIAGSLLDYPLGLSRPSPWHDLLAYGFCFVLAVNFISLGLKNAGLLIRGLPLALVSLALIALVLSVVLPDAVSLMYYDTRLQLLSKNPNQLALLLLPTPFLVIYVLSHAELSRRWMKTAYLAIGVLSLLMGWMSRSDALSLAWMVGGTVVLFWYGHVLRVDPRWRLAWNGSTFRGVTILTLLLAMIIGSLWNSRVLVSPWHQRVTVLSKMEKEVAQADAEQAAVRLRLWLHAIDATRQSPWSGLGGGGHSGITAPFKNEEAHNTLLDWATQAGLPGAFILTALWSWIAYRLWRNRCAVWFGMFMALSVFSMFHHLLRQPLFWILPLLALACCNPTRMVHASKSTDTNQALCVG